EYVIQVGIQPSKKSAESLVQKLSEKGVKAYYSSVENPGELEGTYYRVRVGFFATINDAQNFGRSVLETNGFPWWVDNRSNDAVGNPTTSENLYETSNTSSNWEEQPAVEETEEVVEEVVEEPAPTQEPAPVQEAVPAEVQPTEVPAQESQSQQEAPAEVEAIPAPAAPALEVEEVTE
ncbi:MAG: SPOR domain-containing protein, partial [Fibrobacteraceae bacterium]|nr:SPOR domain-containing protein [Fibrobacteraceae bacterium]